MSKFEDMKTPGVSPDEFLQSMRLEKYRQMFKDTVKNTQVKENIVAQIAEIVKSKNVAIRIFVADWCKDTRNAFPAISTLVNQIPEIDLTLLHGIKNVPFDKNIRWKIPPSPPEVDTFDLRKIPTIIIFDKTSGEEVGRMIERPEATETVEEEILYHLQML